MNQAEPDANPAVSQRSLQSNDSENGASLRDSLSDTGAVSLAARIAALETRLAALRQLEALPDTIATLFEPGEVFYAEELFDCRLLSPALNDAFDVLHISDAQGLGIRLRQLCGSGLVRAGEDRAGVLWTVEVRDEFHRDP